MSDGTVYMKGLGGAVFEMTLPLQPAIRKQYDAGDLMQVNADGSQYDGPDDLADDAEEPAEDDDGTEVDAPGSDPTAPKAPSKAAAKGA